MVGLLPCAGSLLAWCLLAAAGVARAGHEIIVVESGPNGLYVGTSEHYYAFTHPTLAELSWSSVSVRDKQVLIVGQNNSSQLRRWDELDESSRDVISDLRSDFIASLAGLKLTYAARRLAATTTKIKLDQTRKRPEPARSHWSEVGPRHPRWRAKNYTHPELHAPVAAGLSRTKPAGYWLAPNGSGLGGIGFNYYSVRPDSSLAKRLAGDVFHLDMAGNILDVFSSSVSVRLDPRGSILYRDERFFSYSRPGLPLAVHRLFVQGDFVFFVHRDSTVLAKSVSTLGRRERRLLAQAKGQVRRLCQWQNPPLGYTFALPELAAFRPARPANSTSPKPEQELEQQEQEEPSD